MKGFTDDMFLDMFFYYTFTNSDKEFTEECLKHGYTEYDIECFYARKDARHEW